MVRYIFLICLIITKLNAQSVSYEDVLEFQNINLTKSIVANLTCTQFEGRDIKKPHISRTILYLESLFRAFNLRTYFDLYRVGYNIKDSLYGYNIVGMYRGNLRNRGAILITANYDNLGILKRPMFGDTIMRGANDNATGVSALIQLAVFFNRIKPKENIIFALTSGKHQSMLGAGFLADTINKLDYLKVKYVINLEMLGKPLVDIPNNLLCIQDTATNIPELLNRSISYYFVDIAKGKEFENTFDHTPFFNVLKVPSITLTSFNFTNDLYYLTPKDDYNNVDFEYLHRTTARIGLAVYKFINWEYEIGFDSPPPTPNSQDVNSMYR